MSVFPCLYPQSSAANGLCVICIQRDTWWLFARSRLRLWPQDRTVIHNETWTSSYLPVFCSPLGISLLILANPFSFSHFPPSNPFFLVLQFSIWPLHGCPLCTWNNLWWGGASFFLIWFFQFPYPMALLCHSLLVSILGSMQPKEGHTHARRMSKQVGGHLVSARWTGRAWAGKRHRGTSNFMKTLIIHSWQLPKFPRLSTSQILGNQTTLDYYSPYCPEPQTQAFLVWGPTDIFDPDVSVRIGDGDCGV